MTRRDFFTSASKDMLKDVLGAWRDLHSEMNEASRLTCNDAAFKLGRKSKGLQGKVSARINRKVNNVILNSKGGKK